MASKAALQSDEVCVATPEELVAIDEGIASAEAGRTMTIPQAKARLKRWVEQRKKELARKSSR